MEIEQSEASRNPGFVVGSMLGKCSDLELTRFKTLDTTLLTEHKLIGLSGRHLRSHVESLSNLDGVSALVDRFHAAFAGSFTVWHDFTHFAKVPLSQLHR